MIISFAKIIDHNQQHKFFQHNIILPMALHINLQQLPQISLSKLQESCATHKNILNKHNCHDQLSQAHTKGIMVQSPFYQRNEDHKGPCTCAYHRMKRYKEVATVFKGSTSKKAKDEIQKYKSRIAAAVRSSIDVKKEDRKAILKVKAKAIFRTNDNSFEQKSDSYSARQRMKSELDDYNYLFEQILKKRMAPMMDKQKTSNLIKFIKITSKINPNYLKKVRELIFNYLDKVVQKVSYTKLAEEEGNAQIEKKTAHIINGTRQLAAEFIKGIHKSIKDMENFIIETAHNNFKREEQQLNEAKSFNKICSSLNKLESGHSSKNVQIQQTDNNDKKSNEKIQGWQQENQLDKKIHQPIKQKLNRQTCEDQKIGITFANNTEDAVKVKQPFIHTKRSNVSFNNQLKVLFGRDSIVTEIKEEEQANKLNVIDQNKVDSYKSSSTMNKTKRENDDKYVPDTKVKTLQNDEINDGNVQKDKIQKQKDVGISQKSLKSDVSERKNTVKVVPKDKKKKKKGKGKLTQKKDLFNSIEYLNLLTKQEFQTITNLLRDDYYLSDKEKMNRVFNIIERRISGNPQYFNDFVTKFENLMTPEQLALLKQKYKSSEFNKMLTKLTKQVDLCLIQIKHADDLIWRQDFIENNGNDKQSTFQKKTFCLDINNTDNSLMTQFKKFTIVQNNPVQVQAQSPSVSQKQIGQIYLQDIVNIPSIKQSVRVNKIMTKPIEKQEEEMHYSGGVVDQENHKKILRYLKVKNPLAFHKVRLSVKDTLENSMALEN